MIRLTRAGTALVLATGACFALGRVFGLVEMFYLSGMAFSALAISAVLTLFATVNLGVERVSTPARLRVGSPARVDLRLTNRSRRKTPVLKLLDQVQGSSGASLLLAPIARGKSTALAYRLPTERRGGLEIGPLDVQVGDPLGLTSMSLKAAEKTTLMIHPLLIDLGVFRSKAGLDPTSENRNSQTLADGGDFFALRPYVLGDELRRVSWRASSRTGDLVVKQEEVPKTGRIAVVLNQDASDYQNAEDDNPGFERAVSAALSVLHAAWKGGDSVFYLASGAKSVASVSTRTGLDAIDAQLAILHPSNNSSLHRSIEECSSPNTNGTLVVITGRLDQTLWNALQGTSHGYSRAIVIACEQDEPSSSSATSASPETEPNLGRSHGTPPAVVRHDGVTSLSQNWTNHVITTGVRR